MQQGPLLALVGGSAKLSSCCYAEAACGGLLSDVLGFALEHVLFVEEHDVVFTMMRVSIHCPVAICSGNGL